MGHPTQDRGSSVEWCAIVACILPALLFNVAATSVDLKVSLWSLEVYAKVSLAIASVLAAPIALMVLSEARSKGEIVISLSAFVVAAGAILFNTTNALDKVAQGRADVSEGRAKVSQDVSRLTERRHLLLADVAEGRKRSQGVSADVVEQDLTTLRTHAIFKRTKGCLPEETDRQDSVDWCALYRGATARLEAAKTVKAALVALADIDAKLAASGPVATDTDPQVANLATLLNMDQRLLAAILNVRVALMVELIGTLGPMILRHFFAQLTRRRPEEEEPVAEPDPRPTIREVVAAVPQHVPEDLEMKAVTMLPDPHQHVEMFTRQCLTRTAGAELPAADMYEHYVKWCGMVGRDFLGQHQFGAVLKTLGFEKVKKRTIRYQDVAVKQRA